MFQNIWEARQIFSAIILGCIIETQTPTCQVMAFPSPLPTIDVCLESLSAGMRLAESNGWTVVGYTCYNWNDGRDLKDLL
jgi:hypothetical protein